MSPFWLPGPVIFSDVSEEKQDPGSTAANGGEHEFGREEDAIFRDLAKVMMFVAVASVIFGLVAMAGGFLDLLGDDAVSDVGGAVMSIVQGAVFVLLGTWLRTASRAFAEIATTEGWDVAHLMSALQDLVRVYRLQAWILAVGLAAGIATIVYLLVG